MAAPLKPKVVDTIEAQPNMIEVYQKTPVATVKTVTAAFHHIATWWQGENGWTVDPKNHLGDVVEQFEFFADGHRFTVLVEPMDAPDSRKVS
jgi:hypothetical protein